ncbi:MAG: hypothetical protein L3J69_10700 [Desulfobacula sp.]|nr:hypothetical protein [Desulfobacula sp.]
MTHTSDKPLGHHCTVLEQKHLVSEMTDCDQTYNTDQSTYECYLKATRKSRENAACMYS